MSTEALETEKPATAPAPAPSLRESLEAAIEVHENEPSEPTEVAEPAKTAPAPTPPAEEEPTEPDLYADPEKKVAQPEEKPDGKKQPAEDPAEVHRAPKSWKPDAKAKWEATDPLVQREVVRREREIQRALNESGAARQLSQSLQEVTRPYAQRYQQAGMTPVQVIKNLMEADHALAFSPGPQKAQLMAKLIKDYQVDVGLLDAALSGGDPEAEPLSMVERIVEQRLAPIAKYVETSQQREANRITQDQQAQAAHIQRMEENEKDFPHFETVRQDMADLIELNARRGVYLSPEVAYTRAVAMNPEASAAEQEIAKQRNAVKANSVASRSLGASLSVNGAPARLNTSVSPTDLRGTIEAAFAAASGR
jgi:hypothetical protein